MPNQGIRSEFMVCSSNSVDKTFFTEKLINWNSIANGRKMPWKGEKNPYRIWLSEIILQQTRVEQGLDYYNRFVSVYPTLQDLAAAPENDIFKMWEGLGYYRRCKNMLAAARQVTEEMNGSFPTTYEEINSLKGVGPYTAAAIASFAYNLPYAVVDGNVFRVLARFFGISLSIDSASGKKYFMSLANELLDKANPATYNQAIMDFGAIVCKPQPECVICPLKTKCVAYQKNTVNLYPVKEKKKERSVRWFYYVIAEHEDGYYIRQRDKKDIWENLHEFYLIDTADEMPINDIIENANALFPGSFVLDVSKSYKQHLTHQTIKGKFIHIRLQAAIRLPGFTYFKKEELKKIAFPRYITTYFQDSRILN